MRNDQRKEFEVPLEVMEEDESAQFLHAQRVLARSKRAARTPRCPPDRREEFADVAESDFVGVAGPDS